MAFNNFLVIKLRYLGDVLLSTPTLKALKEAFPGARLTLGINRGTEDVVRHNPHVDQLLVIDKGAIRSPVELWAGVRRRRFDCVIDLTDGDRSALLGWWSGAKTRIGFNAEHRWRGLLYTTVVPAPIQPVHRIERDLSALRGIGLDPKQDVPILRISPADDESADQLLAECGLTDAASHDRLVLFQPGARYWFKAWPPERFAELADLLAKAYHCRVLIGGDETERPLAEQIARRATSKPTVIAGRTSVLVFAALAKRCALFVGNDSGAMHIAAAMGTPVLALFGPSDPREWGPLAESKHVIYKGLDCRACFHPTCTRGSQNCMQLISVEEVFASAKHLLDGRKEIHLNG